MRATLRYELLNGTGVLFFGADTPLESVWERIRDQLRTDIVNKKVQKLIIYSIGSAPTPSQRQELTELWALQSLALALVTADRPTAGAPLSPTLWGDNAETIQHVQDLDSAIRVLGIEASAPIHQLILKLREPSDEATNTPSRVTVAPEAMHAVVATGKPTPSPAPVQILGNLHQLSLGNGGCLYDAILKLSHEFDDSFRLQVAGTYWHVLTNIDAMKEVMITNAKNFPKGETLTELRAIGIGAEGIVEVEGERWLRQRRLCLPAFRQNHLESMEHTIRDKTARLMALFDEAEEVEILDAMCRVALAIICQVGFGYHNHCLDSLTSTDPVLYTNHFASEELMKRMKRTSYWKYLPAPNNFKLKKLLRGQKEFFRKIIHQKTAREDSDKGTDLLDLFMQARDEDGSQFTESELVDQMQNFMGAAFESIGTTLHWLFYFLDRHPDVRASDCAGA